MSDRSLTHIIEGDGLFFIAGPCAIEGEEMAMRIADRLVEISDQLDLPLVFKGSYRKANRSRGDSFTGIGDEKALKVLRKVSSQFGIPVTTDVHETKEIEMVADSVDVIQIPAFLCRQTELIQAAADSGCVVNIKKGQFMGPEAMKFAADKVKSGGQKATAWLTERGTTFGYQDLVVDFRSIPVMRPFANKVIMDCTHSLQQPNQSQGVTGGRPELIGMMARTAVAAGAQGLFLETHYNPSEAQSDAANMLPLEHLESILRKALRIYEIVNG